jgi:serine/threonine protein kinase
MSITNVDHVCINCMREKENSGVCPYCGFDESQYEPSPHHLPPRSILGGKCLIGRVLGEGGFGITYLGWDLNLDLKLAIKEYYPTGYVTRTNTATSTVTPYRGEKTEFFTTGRSRFINEAKTLAKYYTLPGIVSVRDFFLENGTAYIVMEFVEGETLKQRLARVGGKMEAGEIFELVRPLLRSLSEMHASGLIHRDISPDNIMITPENNIKLIDFGAARDYLDSGNRSLSVMLKPGFAPEEQYFARGQQGPWTDIYALCATIYRAITGTTPQESVERLRHDELQPPSALGARLTPAQEAALMKGLSVAQEGRWQTVPELYADLYGDTQSSDALNKKIFPIGAKRNRKESIDGCKQDETLKENPANVTEAESKLPSTSQGQEAAQHATVRKKRGTLLVAALGGILFISFCVFMINSMVTKQKIKRLETYFATGEYATAMKFMDQLDTDSGVYDDALLTAAHELLDDGEFEKADLVKAQIVEIEQKDMDSLDDQIAYQKAESLLKKGDFSSAEATLSLIKNPEPFDMVTLQSDIAIARIRSQFANGEPGSAILGITFLKSLNRDAADQLISEYTTTMYDYAVSLYRISKYSQSGDVFELIPGSYQRTKDYLLLVEAHQLLSTGSFSWTWTDTSDDKRSLALTLIAMAGWEDAGDILLQQQQTTILFLLGRWSTGSTYFKIEEKNHETGQLWGYWNISGFPGGTWGFKNGTFSIENSKHDPVNYADFSIIDTNKITITVLSSGKTLTLTRN